MNNRSIKARANELIAYCKPQYIRILFIMAVISMIPNAFSSTEATALLYVIANVLLLPFSHGYVVTSLKIVRNNFNELSDQDALVGLKRFKELFFTYFLYGLLVFVALVVVIVILIVMLGASLQDLNTLAIVALAGTIITSIVSMLVGLYGFAFPFLLEKYGYKGMAAIKESIRFIKGHLFDLFKLELSYLGWTLLVAVVQMLLAEVFAFMGTLGSVVAALIAGAIAIFTYLPQYHVARAIFFEEIAYQRYGMDTVYTTDEQNEVEEFGFEAYQNEELGDNDVQ